MAGEVEFGRCPICGQEAVQLERTYFYYDIPCSCCNSVVDGRRMHFEMWRHCDGCRPMVPEAITPSLQCSYDGTEYRISIPGFLPHKIEGAFDCDGSVNKHHI